MIVKVCGITTEEDLRVCVEAGANALGFNFYSKSPRYITGEQADVLTRSVPDGILKVGIFVNESPDQVAALAAQARLDVVQLHGGSTTLRMWRAVPAGQPLEDPGAEAFLIDTPSRTEHGGTGRTFAWSLASGHAGKRIILAGGLDATNVFSAIQAVHPWGVDACSRLESSPGRKDPHKVRDFIQAALNL